MIEGRLHKPALKAIQDLVIQARWMVGNDFPKETVFKLLDDLEYLPALMLEEKENTVFFREYLAGICETNGWPYILNRFEEQQ